MWNFSNYYSSSQHFFLLLACAISHFLFFIKWTQYGTFCASCCYVCMSSWSHAVTHITCSEKCFLHVNKFFPPLLLLLLAALHSFLVRGIHEALNSAMCVFSLMSCNRKMSSASFSFNYSSIKLFMRREFVQDVMTFNCSQREVLKYLF